MRQDFDGLTNVYSKNKNYSGWNSDMMMYHTKIVIYTIFNLQKHVTSKAFEGFNGIVGTPLILLRNTLCP